MKLLSSAVRLKSITDAVCTMKGDDQAYVYRETVDIPAPGLSMSIFYCLFCVVWYGFFIWLGLALMGVGFQPAIVYASLAMGLNGGVRTAMRFRECTAIHVHWEIPVARQRQSLLILSVVSGAFSAVIGFGLLFLLIPDVHNSRFWPEIILVGMAIEGYRGAIKVGVATVDDDFDIDNYTNWTRVRPADPQTGG